MKIIQKKEVQQFSSQSRGQPKFPQMEKNSSSNESQKETEGLCSRPFTKRRKNKSHEYAGIISRNWRQEQMNQQTFGKINENQL